MPERLLLVALLWALPAIADAACARVFGLVCDAPYVVAEVTLVEAGRTRLEVTQSVGEGAAAVGEEITLTTMDTDRRHDRLVVSQGFRMGEVFNGAFNHFGAEVRLDELETLRADPAACEAELLKRGAEPPDCDDVLAGCASASAGWLGLLVFGLFSLQKTRRRGSNGCRKFRNTRRRGPDVFRKLRTAPATSGDVSRKLRDASGRLPIVFRKLRDPSRPLPVPSRSPKHPRGGLPRVFRRFRTTSSPPPRGFRKIRGT